MLSRGPFRDVREVSKTRCRLASVAYPTKGNPDSSVKRWGSERDSLVRQAFVAAYPRCWATKRSNGGGVEYWVDADDRLTAVDAEFRAFATDNGAPELASNSILGRRMSSFCSDDATTEIWLRLLSRARAGARIALQIRCDSPDKGRLLSLDLSVDEGGRIRVVSTTLSQEHRPRIPLLERAHTHGDRLLVCCSWCKKWRQPTGTWVEAEELVATQRLFEEEVLPGVSHGICEECRASLRKGGGA